MANQIRQVTVAIDCDIGSWVHGFQQGGLVFRAQLYPVAPAFHREINALRFLSRL
jgi:hypothetical protein